MLFCIMNFLFPVKQKPWGQEKIHFPRPHGLFPMAYVPMAYFEMVSVTSFAITNSGAPM